VGEGGRVVEGRNGGEWGGGGRERGGYKAGGGVGGGNEAVVTSGSLYVRGGEDVRGLDTTSSWSGLEGGMRGRD